MSDMADLAALEMIAWGASTMDDYAGRSALARLPSIREKLRAFDALERCVALAEQRVTEAHVGGEWKTSIGSLRLCQGDEIEFWGPASTPWIGRGPTIAAAILAATEVPE